MVTTVVIITTAVITLNSNIKSYKVLKNLKKNKKKIERSDINNNNTNKCM